MPAILLGVVIFASWLVAVRAQMPRLLPGQPDDHFLCYRVKDVTEPRFISIPQVSLSDRFQTGDVDVRGPLRICTPADKEGEGQVDPATHLKGYKIKPGFHHARRKNVEVQNEFGAFFVDTVRPDSLLIPSSKDRAVDPPLPGPNNVDRYQCYKAKSSKGHPKITPILSVLVSDQFGTRTLDFRKPTRLCVPVDKQGDGIKNPGAHLLCLQARRSRAPQQGRFNAVANLHVNNEFGLELLNAMNEDEFCVASIGGLGLPTPTAAVTFTPTPIVTSTSAVTPTPTQVGNPSPTPTSTPIAVCGDEIATSAEVCDGGDLRSETCSSLGFTGGTLTCMSNCHGFDSRACTFPLGPPPDPVAPPLDPTVPTDIIDASIFLYTGPDRIQYGVGSGTIELRRAALISGKILERDGGPLGAVRVTVVGHPEFGGTLTRLDGRYNLVVNGGGVVVFRYEKNGYLPVERQTDTPWQDYKRVEDVALVPVDNQVTVVDLTSTAPIQDARGSVATDGDGSRQATLLFSQGTIATMTFADGSTQPLSTLHVRATEYSVGPNGKSAMPAQLPPTSAYTYAVEFGADEAITSGAAGISFNQPVVAYLENFLGFPTGEPVPTGYYDSTKSAWVASDNGRVLEVLSTTNGIAELDVDGTGVPATIQMLADLGVTDAERQKLADLYQAGQRLWRVPITHFSPWDFNWPAYAPADATAAGATDPVGPVADACTTSGSIIDCENQILGEAIEVSGTSLTLHSRSDRTTGYTAARTIKIPISETVPASLKRIDLEIHVAGRSFRDSRPPNPNQIYTFTWDGKDNFGRILEGTQSITFRIGYAYDEGYAKPTGTKSFGVRGVEQTTSVTSTTELTGRREVILWRALSGAVGSWSNGADALGGWGLDVHHAYDPRGRVLYLGNGTRRSTRGSERIIDGAFPPPGCCTSQGCCDYSSLVVPPTEPGLFGPVALAAAPDGSLYIADVYNDRIRRLSPDGILTTVAGTGDPGVTWQTGGYSGDGGPATQAQIDGPSGVAVAPDGTLYIADTANYCVRRVGLDGIITTYAGTCLTSGYSGDGGPASQALLSGPNGLALDAGGTLYVADHNGVRAVATDGTIRTATNVYRANQVAVAPDGSLYVGGNNCVIVRVDLNGRVQNVTGSCGYSGDGGPATDAQVSPIQLAVDKDGSLYFPNNTYVPSQGIDSRIRRIGADGIISTVAGNGISVRAGDGGPATQGSLSYPFGVALGADGNLYESEWGSNSIRRVSSALPILSGTDIAISSEDGAELYEFDFRGRHLRTVSTLTGAVIYRFTYDGGGRLTSIEDGDSNVVQIERDANGAATAIVGPFGHRTTLTVGAGGDLEAITNPASERTTLTYYPGGLLSSLTDPLNHTASFTYDVLGRLIRDDDAGGGFKTLTRAEDVSSDTVTVTTALGRTHTYRTERLSTGDTRRTFTDPSGLSSFVRLNTDGTSVRQSPNGMTISQQKGPDSRFGMLAPITSTIDISTPQGISQHLASASQSTLSNSNDPLSLTQRVDTVTINGRTFTSTYTASPRRHATHSPEGRTMTSELDSQGRVIQSSVPGVTPVSLHYDVRGRLDQTVQGARISSIAYDPQGNVSSATDSLGRTTTYTYDAAGRLSTQTLPDLRVIAYDYDGDGNLSSLTPPSRPAHTFVHDATDRLTDYTAPDLGPGTRVTHTTYNQDHRPIQVDRPGPQDLTFSYDSAGRLEIITQPAGQTLINHDAQTGNVSDVTGYSGERTDFHYDGSLPTREDYSGSITGSTSRTYNNDFQITSTSVNDANTVTYGYDQDGMLTSAGTLTLQRSAQNGLLAGTTQGQLQTTIDRDAFGSPQGVAADYASTTLFTQIFTRDDGGRIIEKQETTDQGTQTYAYTYDPTGRLTDVTKNGVAHATYAYDQNSNRTSVTKPGQGMTVATYDAQDRLLTYGTKSYAYTAAGDLAQVDDTSTAQTTTYDYDAQGALTHVSLPAGTEIDYVTDARGRRVAKNRNGALEQGFLYAGAAISPVAELDAQGSLVSRFVYATRSNVPDYMTKNGDTYRIVADDLGSPRVVVDTSDGSVAQRIDYDEFGRVTRDTNPGFQPFGYAGGLYDHDTKLVRFGARDYDSSTGRWTNKDPIGFKGGDSNLYGYVVGDPVNGVDPSGLLRAWSIPIPGPIEDAGNAIGDAGNSVGGAVSDTYNGFTGAAQNALEYYANQSLNPCHSSLENTLWAIPGSFAALGTSENLPTTAWTLGTFGYAGAAEGVGLGARIFGSRIGQGATSWFGAAQRTNTGIVITKTVHALCRAVGLPC